MPSRRDFESAEEAMRQLEEAKKPMEQIIREATPTLIRDIRDTPSIQSVSEELDQARNLERYPSIIELAETDRHALQEATRNSNYFASVAEEAIRNSVQDIDSVRFLDQFSDPSFIRDLSALSTADEVLRAQEAMRQSLTPPDVTAATRLTLQNILENPLSVPTAERLREIEELVASPFVRDLVQRVDPAVLRTEAAPPLEEDVSPEPAPSDTIEYYGVDINSKKLLNLAVLLYIALTAAEANALAMSQPELAAAVGSIKKALIEIGSLYAFLEAIRKSQNDEEN